MDDAQQRSIANEQQKPKKNLCLEMILWVQNTIKYGIDRLSFRKYIE